MILHLMFKIKRMAFREKHTFSDDDRPRLPPCTSLFPR